ncbi:hypothetical protein Q3G72_018826 [Acer saccharum]|nr:hypothetical protein Q3G72_018826 [Acer saccharum]
MVAEAEMKVALNICHGNITGSLKYLNAIKAFSQLKIKLGSTLQDKVINGTEDNKQPCVQFVKKDQRCLVSLRDVCQRTDGMNSMLASRNRGTKIIFGLNALTGRTIQPDGAKGAWDYTNAESLIRYTVQKNYFHGWELGNELCGSGVGTRVAAIRVDQHLVDKIIDPSYLDASGKVVGGDVAKADGIFASINFNSIVTLDIDSGRIAWAKQLGDYDVFYFACLVPDNPDCPPGPNLDADFGEAPMLLTIYANGTICDIVVAVQKSGFAWALNGDNGEIVWFKLAGPGGEEGGGQWGAATDGRRVYTNIANSNRVNFTLAPSGQTTTVGAWVALDAYNGEILWSTANPSNDTATR